MISTMLALRILCYNIHLLIYLFTHLLIYSFIHLFVRSFVRSFIDIKINNIITLPTKTFWQQRYEKAIALEKDHLFEINYAITLYNMGDLEKSKQHLNDFERLFSALDEESKNSDSDILEKRQQLLALFAPGVW